MSYIDKEELIGRMRVCAPNKSDREVVESCAEIKVIPIPPRATNGDMIKALFPNCEIMATDDKFYYMELDSYIPVPIYKNWWNAPYRKE